MTLHNTTLVHPYYTILQYSMFNIQYSSSYTMPHNTSVFHKYSFTMPNSTQKLNIPQYTIVHSIIQSIKILDKYNIFIIYTIFPYYLQSYATKNNSLYKIPIQYLQYTITINIRQYFYTI